MTQIMETRDPDIADSIVRQLYTSVAMAGRDEHFLLRVEQGQLGPVRMDTTTFGLQLTYHAAPMGALCIGLARRGTASYEFRREQHRRRRGDVFLVAQPEAAFHGSVDHLQADFAVFDAGLLTHVADPGPGDDGTIRLLDLNPISPKAAARWRHTYGTGRALARDPETPPLVAAHAARLLAAVTLSCFPSTAQMEANRADRHDAHPATVSRAIAFMESAPASDITVADIAAAANVSVRAVQLAFRRHLGTTPMAHLRRLRLEGVRDELLAHGPHDATVTAVAARWGFLNSSRFAAQYRDQFGESPNITLNG